MRYQNITVRLELFETDILLLNFETQNFLTKGNLKQKSDDQTSSTRFKFLFPEEILLQKYLLIKIAVLQRQ